MSAKIYTPQNQS